MNTECHTVQNLAKLNLLQFFHCLHAVQSVTVTAVVLLGFMLLGHIVESSKDYKSKINDYSNDHRNASNTMKTMVLARVARAHSPEYGAT